MKFGTREHHGGLKESLETTIYITEEEFRLKSRNYNYYGYDTRCNQILFIEKPLEKYIKEPLWLFIELDKEI